MTPREIALSICEPWFNGDPCEGCECHKVCTKLVERIEIAIRAERVPETNFGNIPQPVAYISGYHKGRCIIEPVGYANKKGLFRCADDADEAFKASAIPLYATPPKREPLTDEEIKRIDDNTHFHESTDWYVRFARAIERAHGIGGEE